MPDCSRVRFVLLIGVLIASSAWAQSPPPPSLKQLLELDTQQAAQEKSVPATPRVVRPPARPELMAIYGLVGQRTVLVRLGNVRLLFQENQAASLPPSSYQLLDIKQHCASFRRTGSKTAHHICLNPGLDALANKALPPSPQVASPLSLPWPVKDRP